jgi:SAM-dependent methyltransferase
MGKPEIIGATMVPESRLRERRVVTNQAARGDRLNPEKSNRLYWHLVALRKEIEAVIAQFIKGKRHGTLVDFGCGSMPYRPLFEPHVSEYLGCDLEGNELADVLLDHVGRLPADDNSFDVVLSSQVLEHVADPALYLEEAFRVLRAGGLLVLSTHGTWRYHPDPTDFWRWTCDGLRHQLEGSGFEILRFRGVMGPASTALQLWQDSMVKRMPVSLRDTFTRYMQWRIRRADLRCSQRERDRDACVYVTVATKPV